MSKLKTLYVCQQCGQQSPKWSGRCAACGEWNTLVEEGAVLGANVTITSSTPVIDVTGPQPVEYRGRVPARSVVVPGTRPKTFPGGTYDLPCALIIGRRSESTDRKTSLNEALRVFEVPV